MSTWTWEELAHGSLEDFEVQPRQRIEPFIPYFKAQLKALSLKRAKGPQVDALKATTELDSAQSVWLDWEQGRQAQLFFPIGDARSAPTRAVFAIFAELALKREGQLWLQELSLLRQRAGDGQWGAVESVAGAVMALATKMSESELIRWCAPLQRVELLLKSSAALQLRPDLLSPLLELHESIPPLLLPALYQRISTEGFDVVQEALVLSRYHPSKLMLWLSDTRPMRRDWQRELWLKSSLSLKGAGDVFRHGFGAVVPHALLVLAGWLSFLAVPRRFRNAMVGLLVAVCVLSVSLVLELQVLERGPALELQWEKPTPSLQAAPSEKPIEEKPMSELSLETRTLQLMLFFLALQVCVLIASCASVKKISRQTESPDLRLKLIDNEEVLFDLGLYIGLGGTVLSLVFMFMGQDQQGMMAAYSSTLFGILEVAIFKVFILRPYRQKLIVQA